MRIFNDTKELTSEVKRDLFEMWEKLIMKSMQNKKWEFWITELQWYQFMIELNQDAKKFFQWLFNYDEFLLAEVKKIYTYLKNSNKQFEEELDEYLEKFLDALKSYKQKIKDKNLFEIVWLITEKEYDDMISLIESWELKNMILQEVWNNVIEYLENILKKKIINDKLRLALNEVFKYWILLDFNERVSEELINPWKAYLIRGWVWKNFLEKYNKFSYTYWTRIMELINTENWKKHKLYIIKDELLNKPTTRQAIVTIFDSNKDLPKLWWKERIPCSMHYQFIIRSSWKRISRRNWKTWIKELNWAPEISLHYFMRSCDLLTHFPIDIMQARNLVNYMRYLLSKEWLKLELWKLFYNAASLHAYDYDLVEHVF